MREKLVIFLIVFLALLLRIIDINNNPPALYGDELTIALDAKSLLETGRDQTGASFPLTFSMGAGRPPGYVYGSLPFVAIFGPTTLGVRGLSILSGLGIVFLIYILVKRFFSSWIGLIAAVLTAISPWALSLSRGGFEVHFALFLALASVLTFLAADKIRWLYIISALAFGLSIHTYPTFKLTLPLIFILLVWYRHGLSNLIFLKKPNFIFVLASIITISAIILSLSQTFIGGSETRFWSINIFAKDDLRKDLTENINIDRNADILPRLASELFHNKVIEYNLILGEAYLRNFSLDFLFFHGDKNPRHNMMTSGGFYLVEMLTILYGLIFLFKRKREFVLILGWILIGPTASAILLEPHFLRSSFMLPPLILLSALGVSFILTNWSKWGFWKYGLILIFLLQIFILYERLYFVSPNEFSSFWAYPAKKATQTVLENQNHYSEIIVSDRVDNIEFAYPVYANIPSADVINQNQQRITKDGYKFKQFGKVFVGNIPEATLSVYLAEKPDTLYIGAVEEKDALKDYDIILGKDGLPGFLLVGRQHLR